MALRVMLNAQGDNIHPDIEVLLLRDWYHTSLKQYYQSFLKRETLP